MKYWFLFMLRMLLRISLLMSVLMWLMGFRGVGSWKLDSPIGLFTLLNQGEWSAVSWRYSTEIIPMRATFVRVKPPGMEIWLARQGAGVHIDHWCLCLLLLIAVVITSRKWKRRATRAPNEQTPVAPAG